MDAQTADKIEKLIDHGRKSVWHPARDVDWDLRSGALEKISGEEREALRSILSLVYYSDSQGQRILTTLCRALDAQPRVPVPLAEKVHEFFIQQMDDEARHTEGLRLLFSRLKLELEPRAITHAVFSRFLFAEGFFEAKLVVIYWYIEILAKGIFAELRRRFPETYLDSLFSRIIRDEARHVGFGEVYLPAHSAQAGAIGRSQLAAAYFGSAAAAAPLYRFTRYSRAARILGLDLGAMFSGGFNEISARASKLPRRGRLFDLKRPAQWVAAWL